MGAHPQVGLHKPDLIGVETWAVKSATAESIGTQARKSVRKPGFASVFPQSFEERAIAGRDLFLHILSVERNRSARSGKPFMLMLLHSSEILQGQSGNRTLSEIQRGIFSAIRDTDIVGWYEEGAALGIILTEITEPNQVIAATILERMVEAISNQTAAEHVDNMEFSCHMGRGGAGSTETFESIPVYPELHLHPRQRPPDAIERKPEFRDIPPPSVQRCATSGD